MALMHRNGIAFSYSVQSSVCSASSTLLNTADVCSAKYNSNIAEHHLLSKNSAVCCQRPILRASANIWEHTMDREERDMLAQLESTLRTIAANESRIAQSQEMLSETQRFVGDSQAALSDQLTNIVGNQQTIIKNQTTIIDNQHVIIGFLKQLVNTDAA